MILSRYTFDSHTKYYCMLGVIEFSYLNWFSEKSQMLDYWRDHYYFHFVDIPLLLNTDEIIFVLIF